MASRSDGRLADHAEPALLLVPGLLCLVFAYFLPVGLLVAESFFATAEDGQEVLTLAPYVRFFTDSYYHGVMLRTFKLALVTTLVTLALGFPIALIMARNPGRIAVWLGILVIMPLMVSVVVRTFGWMVLMGRGGLLSDLAQGLGIGGRRFVFMRTEPGIVIALAQVLLPFMTLTLYGVVSRIEPVLEQAARVMGAGYFATMWRVTLPLSLPGIVAGSLLVFALSISSFITPTLIGGVRLPVLAGSIYQEALITINWQFAAALSVILLITVLLVIVPYTMFARTRYA